MSTDPEPAQDATTGWARLPEWQHLILIVLCAFGLVAAIANTIVASSNGNRAIHVVFGVVAAAVLVTLISSFQRRRRV